MLRWMVLWLIVCYCRFNQLFGVLGILDRLHGTDDVYRQSKEYERHMILLGLNSAKELIPDPPKEGKLIK